MGFSEINPLPKLSDGNDPSFEWEFHQVAGFTKSPEISNPSPITENGPLRYRPQVLYIAGVEGADLGSPLILSTPGFWSGFPY